MGAPACRNCSSPTEEIAPAPASDAGRIPFRPELFRDRDGGFRVRRRPDAGVPDAVAPAPSIE